MSDLYDTDGYTWAMRQAEALRKRSANEIDWDNVAEEIESLGKSQASELENRYVVLLAHLLKWMFQAEKRSRSWEASVRTQRIQAAKHLAKNPGLKGQLDEIWTDAYAVARIQASGETDLPLETFPEANPFTLDQAMDPEFWPQAAA
ncbi:MAG TPA: DUF29 domain-containing protein [Caulobacterales bacterium]|jgi:hypothetical protein|nr:DUF29 domain-containing protein [Caulobacterales bacterium]